MREANATIRLRIKRKMDDKEFEEIVSGEEALTARMANLERCYPGKLKLEAFSNWMGHEGQETRTSGRESLAVDDFPMEHHGPR